MIIEFVVISDYLGIFHCTFQEIICKNIMFHTLGPWVLHLCLYVLVHVHVRVHVCMYMYMYMQLACIVTDQLVNYFYNSACRQSILRKEFCCVFHSVCDYCTE